MSEPDPVLPAVQAAFDAHFGQQPVRASVSFVGVEPIEVLRYEPVPDERAYLSFGMSRHPMTPATEVVQDPRAPRAELMLHLRDPLDTHADVWRRLAVLAAAPAVEGVVYEPGMTVDLGEPLVAGSRCTGVLVGDSPLTAVVTSAGTVNVLQVSPATSAELAWARVRGGAALREAWTAQQVDLLDLARPSAALG